MSGSNCASMVFDHDDAARRRPRAHTEATERGGISMQEQIMEMKADAAQQEHLVTLVAELMEEEVAARRQARRQGRRHAKGVAW